MNRIILFRGKRIDRPYWVGGDLLVDPDGKTHIRFQVSIVSATGTEYTYETVEVVAETVGQFSGMLDISGRRIFENDVIKASIIEIGVSNMEFVVFFEGAGFCVRAKKIITPSLRLDDLSNCVVVGNIHDNE